MKPFRILMVAAALAFAPAAAMAYGQAMKKDVVDVAASDAQFSTLVAAVQAAGLVETLKTAEAVTIFAPTNDAFAKLPEGTVENLLKPENKDQLVAILTYHVVGSAIPSSAVVGKTANVTTLQGGELAVDGTDGVKVGAASVIAADVMASNGVIHVIDTVLIPPAE